MSDSPRHLPHECQGAQPPGVSVLIPVYNAGEHLGRCLDSLAAQTFHDFEAIALDDGSTDDSLARLRAFAAAHPFLCVETQSNAGVPTTRNRLIKMARGEFVMFMDNDDAIEPDYIGRHGLWRGDMRVFPAVVAFLLIRRLGLLPVFARIFCRGARRKDAV